VIEQFELCTLNGIRVPYVSQLLALFPVIGLSWYKISASFLVSESEGHVSCRDHVFIEDRTERCFNNSRVSHVHDHWNCIWCNRKNWIAPYVRLGPRAQILNHHHIIDRRRSIDDQSMINRWSIDICSFALIVHVYSSWFSSNRIKRF
jgi:hypothetical protein